MPAEIEIVEARDSDMEMWDSYVRSNTSSSIYHLSGWRKIIASEFQQDTHYMMAVRRGAVIGVLPLVRLKSLLFGDFVVSMPYLTYGGVVADDDVTERALIDAAAALGKKLGVSHVELRHTSDVIDFPKRTEKVAMQLTLCGDSDELWSRLGSKRRAQIKRPQKEGAKIQIGGAELLQDFYRIFATKYRDLGVPVYPIGWFEAVFAEFEEHAKIFVARIDEQPVAASVVLGYDKMLEVPWAASLRSADRLGINMFLYWEMLKFAEESGFTTFDFGRSTKDSGTWRFKKQWGAEPVQLYWHYWLKAGAELPQLNTANPKYELAVAMWRKLPLWATKLVGPRLVRNLP